MILSPYSRFMYKAKVDIFQKKAEEHPSAF